MLRGSFFEVFGYGAQQVLRLAGNLVTTRLLFPAAFGLASIVTVIIMGLVMLSDLALNPCVVQSARGDDPAFLNTAFTIQVVRGVVLSLLMVGLAAPAAWFYHEPQLVGLVCLGSLQLLIGGFHSSSVFTLRRSLRLGWVNGLELGQSIVTILLTVILARFYRSAWSLIGAGVLGTCAFVIASHLVPVPYRNRFQWDKTAADEIRNFGRWVLGSSVATFLSGQSDRILIGRFLGAAWLGVYSIALMLSDAAGSLVSRLVNGVMYPVLSEAARRDGGNIGALYYRLRRRFDLLSMVGTGLLGGLGTWIVLALWDKRYAAAAWILQILSVRVAISSLVSPSETCLFSLGHTRQGFQRSVARLLTALIAIPAGWHFWGVKGLVWGTVAAEGATLFAIWPKTRQLGILRIGRELASVGIFLCAFALGRIVSPWLPILHAR
jgi:O-antigen/teichoic acid export membrane protein